MLPLNRLYSSEALHIPDGFLSPPVAIVGWLLAVAAVAFALRKTQNELGERQIPILGVMSAFIFAAQAINFPVAGGTSGHLIGGALAAIVMGPWSAVLVMTAVVGLQGLLFQDGGLLVMGWNILNMAILAPLGAWLFFILIRRLFAGRGGLIAPGALAAWVSVELAAAATAVELALSGTAPLVVVLSAMVGVHALIGVGEGLITVGALLMIARTRPDLLRPDIEVSGRQSAAWVAGGLTVALALAILTIVASPAPDGLERVAEDAGFLDRAQDPLFRLLPDYMIPAIEEAGLSGILAVVAGTAFVFVLVLLSLRLLRRLKRPSGVDQT